MAYNNANVNGTIAFNTSTSGTTSIGTGSNSGTISIGNASSGGVTLDCGTAGISVGATANNHTSTLGTTSGTSTTNINAGSGGIGLTGVVTSANAITITSGNMTASSGNVVITAGNLTLPNTTNTPTGEIQFGGNRWISNFGSRNAFIGQIAGNTTLTTGSATDNTMVGYNVGATLTSGASNCTLGANALSQVTSGSFNVSIGMQSMLSLQGGSANCGLGQNALVFITSGSNNTALGVTGSGTGAGQNYNGAESSNIVINNAGVNGESNVIRIGTAGSGAGQQNKAFIAGIFGVTVGATGVPVVVDNAGQLGTVVSSIRFKENIKDLNENVLDLRPVEFTYKNDESKSRRFGLIAEEVVATIPDLVVYDADKEINTVKYQELSVLLLAEIKKLNKRIKILEDQLRH